VKCADCRRLDRATQPNFAAVGYGVCPLDPSGVYVKIALERSCPDAVPVEETSKEKRDART
jgi:hypothetical protein